MRRGNIAWCILLLLVLISSLVACSGPTSGPTPNPKPPGAIKATWIEPQVVGDTVSIPVSEVEDNKIVHFKLVTLGGDIAFMAYELGVEVYIRSNVCPPCRSVGFSLQGDTLVCDTCKTTFNAKTGDGIEGACMNFPKASVPYELRDGNLAMKGADLTAAYQSTLNPGWP